MNNNNYNKNNNNNNNISAIMDGLKSKTKSNLHNRPTSHPTGKILPSLANGIKGPYQLDKCLIFDKYHPPEH